MTTLQESLNELKSKQYPCILVDTREDGAALLKWYDGTGKRHRRWISKAKLKSFFGAFVQKVVLQ